MTAPQPPGDLLARLAAQSMDDDYAAVAARSRAGPPDTGSRRGALLVFAVSVALLALLLTVSGLQTRGAASQAAADREALIGRIDVEQADVGQLRDEIAALQGEVNSLRAAVLGAAGQEARLEQTLEQLEMATGAVPVSGPGLRITVDDGRGSAPEAQIRDTDLQVLANGLWEAGAEAIAVGGQRLTTRSAIRTAGQAITVNYRSLSPPYVVSAVGDPNDLAARFLDTDAAQALIDLRAVVGVRFEIESQQSLLLPGRPLSVERAEHDASGSL